MNRLMALEANVYFLEYTLLFFNEAQNPNLERNCPWIFIQFIWVKDMEM